jgi:hypothetical protein
LVKKGSRWRVEKVKREKGWMEGWWRGIEEGVKMECRKVKMEG